MRSSSKGKKQSKLMYILCAPCRTLTKARNFYMRSLEDCAGKVGYGGGGASGYTASQVLPRSFSVNSSSSNDDEDLRQLLRMASSNRSNAEKEKENNNIKSVRSSDVHKRTIVRHPNNSMNGMGMRSYSVGLKMGRIDEETACSFREDEVDVKADLYPRSRSHAVRRRNVGSAY